MKNKLIFRILGALASSLIIVSVFVPFMSVAGHSSSLWQTYESIKSLYLPIMIIVFGVIGVIFFALNIKTEFAYMSTGAISFFVVMNTIDIINQGVFKSLSVGYYLLVIGAILTGVMAFLTNLKSKNKVQVVEEVKEEQVSMIDQIDKLYNEQTTNQSEILPIQPVDNVVQPLPIQPSEIVEPVQPVEQLTPIPVTEEVQLETPVEETQKVAEMPINQPVNPVLQEFNTLQEQTPIVEQQPVVEKSVNQPVNPVLQEFGVQSAPVVEETPVAQETPVNPVLQEFAQATNPVLQEFGTTPSNVVEQTPIVQEQPELNQSVETVPLSNINEPINPTVQEFNNPGITQAPQQNSNGLDIFGQPINK